jgi:hypothetical protein
MDKLTTEEIEGLREDLKRVTNYLPEDLMGKFWATCNKIRGERTNQPCGCKSAGGLWAKCVDDIKNYLTHNNFN